MRSVRKRALPAGSRPGVALQRYERELVGTRRSFLELRRGLRAPAQLPVVSDLELMFEAGDVQRWEVGQAFLQTYLGEDPELLRKRSSVYNAERIRAPVMLIHGKDDWRADFEHAVRMREALEDAGKTVEWLALSGEGHGIYNQETRREVYARLLAFLERYLPLDSVGEATVTATDSPSR